MKNFILKIVIFIISFVAATALFVSLLNSDRDNSVFAMDEASFPTVNFVRSDIDYNTLFGYINNPEVKKNRDYLTIIPTDRSVDFNVKSYGVKINKVAYEVRDLADNKLIENRTLEEFADDEKRYELTLKDLYEFDKEYVLNIVISTDQTENISYRTKFILSDDLQFEEKMDFVKNFHEVLFNKDEAQQIKSYLETSYSKEKNTSFNKVNIYSSFDQVTYGSLKCIPFGEPVYTLCDISGDSATIKVDYLVSITEEEENRLYKTSECYIVKISRDTFYLMDYVREMEEIANPEKLITASGRVYLGINSDELEAMKAPEKPIVAFEVNDSLYSYDFSSKELINIYGYSDYYNPDIRSLNDSHRVKPLKVSDNGDVLFAVYGYFNRGIHEGDVGIAVFNYRHEKNYIEEITYFPVSRSFNMMEADLDKLFYLNGADILYFYLDGTIYSVNLDGLFVSEFVNIDYLDRSLVNESQNIVIWEEEKSGISTIFVCDLESGYTKSFEAAEGETLFPLGFLKEDIVYGTARNDDLTRNKSGITEKRMYKLEIVNSDGEVLKKYEVEDVYICEVTIENGMVSMERAQKNNKGGYTGIKGDVIRTIDSDNSDAGILSTITTDIYKEETVIEPLEKSRDKSVKILRPKFTHFETSHDIELPDKNREEFLVYALGCVQDIYPTPGRGVSVASATRGTLIDSSGKVIWEKAKRSTRNQIVAIKEKTFEEGKSSLASCLETMLEYAGVVRDCQYLLDSGMTAFEILSEALEDRIVLDVSGCEMDSLLYYINRDFPVLAAVDNGEYVLITGYNETNLILFEPAEGALHKKTIQDMEVIFNENDMQFITYIE